MKSWGCVSSLSPYSSFFALIQITRLQAPGKGHFGLKPQLNKSPIQLWEQKGLLFFFLIFSFLCFQVPEVRLQWILAGIFRETWTRSLQKSYYSAVCPVPSHLSRRQIWNISRKIINVLLSLLLGSKPSLPWMFKNSFLQNVFPK